MPAVVDNLHEATGLKSKAQWALTTAGTGAALAPGAGIIPQGIAKLGAALPAAGVVELIPVGLLISAAPFLVASGWKLFTSADGEGVAIPPKHQGGKAPLKTDRELKDHEKFIINKIAKPYYKRKPKPDNLGIELGGHYFTETDLFTNILITGAIGSGKTSASINPTIEKLMHLYNEEDNDPFSKNPYKALGALFLDVKGEFYEGVVYYAYESGRNAAEEIVLVRPEAKIPCMRLVDPDTNYVYHVNAMPCSSPSEASRLIKGVLDDQGKPIRGDIFTLDRRNFLPYEKILINQTFEVEGQDIFYAGWRDSEDGKELVRVANNPKAGYTAKKLDKRGNEIRIPKPKKLKYDGLAYIDSGVRYNVVNPNLPAVEIAWRAIQIGALAENEKIGGENAYFYRVARRAAGYAIDFLRSVSDKEVTAPDIMEIITRDEKLNNVIKRAEDRIGKVQKQIDKEKDAFMKRQLEMEYEKLKENLNFFQKEWGSTDPRAKTAFSNIIANAYGLFLQDAQLRESFCTPSTFTFEDTVQKGKIVCFVPGANYETVAKTIGVILKLDFQSSVMARLLRDDLDKHRFVMFCNDEAQRFIVAGGASGLGDENFMSLCRQARCFNLNATQSISSINNVIGAEEAKTYLQNYGGFIGFQSTDMATIGFMTDMAGHVFEEMKERTPEEFGVQSLMNPRTDGHGRRKFEGRERFGMEDVISLQTWQCISFNRGEKDYDYMWTKHDCKPSFMTSPEGTKRKEGYMRRYFRELIENKEFDRNGGTLFDHIPAPPQPGEEGALPMGGLGKIKGVQKTITPPIPTPAQPAQPAAEQPTPEPAAETAPPAAEPEPAEKPEAKLEAAPVPTPEPEPENIPEPPAETAAAPETETLPQPEATPQPTGDTHANAPDADTLARLSEYLGAKTANPLDGVEPSNKTLKGAQKAEAESETETPKAAPATETKSETKAEKQTDETDAENTDATAAAPEAKPTPEPTPEPEPEPAPEKPQPEQRERITVDDVEKLNDNYANTPLKEKLTKALTDISLIPMDDNVRTLQNAFARQPKGPDATRLAAESAVVTEHGYQTGKPELILNSQPKLNTTSIDQGVDIDAEAEKYEREGETRAILDKLRELEAKLEAKEKEDGQSGS